MFQGKRRKKCQNLKGPQGSICLALKLFKYFDFVLYYLKQIFLRNPVFGGGLDKKLDIVFVGLNISRDYILFIDRVRFDLVDQLANPNTVTEEEIDLNRTLEIEMSF